MTNGLPNSFATDLVATDGLSVGIVTIHRRLARAGRHVSLAANSPIPSNAKVKAAAERSWRPSWRSINNPNSIELTQIHLFPNDSDPKVHFV